MAKLLSLDINDDTAQIGVSQEQGGFTPADIVKELETTPNVDRVDLTALGGESTKITRQVVVQSIERAAGLDVTIN